MPNRPTQEPRLKPRAGRQPQGRAQGARQALDACREEELMWHEADGSYIVDSDMERAWKIEDLSDKPPKEAGELRGMAWNGDAAGLSALLAIHPGLDLGDALHAACGQGHFECVHLLLSRGADPNAKDSHGSTPMASAATEWLDRPAGAGARADADPQGGRADIIALLGHQGAEVDALDIHGFTPLLIACRDHNLAEAQALHALGADLWARTPKREDAFDLIQGRRPGRPRRGQPSAEATRIQLLDWLDSAQEREELLAEHASVPQAGPSSPRARRAKSL